MRFRCRIGATAWKPCTVWIKIPLHSKLDGPGTTPSYRVETLYSDFESVSPNRSNCPLSTLRLGTAIPNNLKHNQRCKTNFRGVYCLYAQTEELHASDYGNNLKHRLITES